MRKLAVVLLTIALALMTLFFPSSNPTVSAAVVSPDGRAWHNPLPQGNHLYAIWGSSSSDVYAVGRMGTILHYDGSSWSPMTSGTTADLEGVWGSSSSDVFAVGAVGTIIRYDGSVWTEMTSGTKLYLNAVWGSSASDVYAVGSAGTILHRSVFAAWDPWDYDTNDTGVIDIDEALAAIADYFDGAITITEVLEVIVLYFSGAGP